MGSDKRLEQRESLEKVLESKAKIENIEYMRDILSTLSSIICIINNKNQVVFTNDILLNKYNFNLEKDIIGKRPGEFLDCVNAENDTGGCGTTNKCEYCGAFNALDISWREKRKVTRECKITSTKYNSTHQLDIEITATPISFEDDYLIISMVDISEKKHKQLLERIFFHDILNIAGGLSGVIRILPDLEDDEKDEYLAIIGSLSDQIVDEIKDQQHMIKAESGELLLETSEIKIDSLLKDITNKIKFHQAAAKKLIDFKDHTNSSSIISDKVLLSRILINMAKNAFEAINEGETILIQAEIQNGKYRFSVHNSSYIPQNVQLQIFKRSFSTKGHNRGLGTYSMKLLGERYLKGEVGFESSKENGTTFHIDLPYNTQ